jgi:hypothetical protein
MHACPLSKGIAVLIGGLAMPVVVNVLTFYAAVKSFRSMQSPDPEDDQQWCDSFPSSPSPPPTVTTNTMKRLYILSLSP